MVLTAGVLTLLSAGSNSARISSTSASGGTAPYTQKWYRSADPSFIPDSSTLINNETSLILNDTNIVPHTTYYYKVVYTDNVLDSVTSEALVVTTFNAGLNPNQFSMVPFIGELDLKSGRGNVISAQIDASQISPLYAGQRVKFVPNSGSGIPKIVSNSEIFMPSGYVVYDQKSQSYNNGDRCEIARTESCIWLYATTAILRGAQVCIDQFVPYGVKEIVGDSLLPIVGEAFDQAIAPGQLIRVILNVPSYAYDTTESPVIVSNVLEINSSLKENSLTQNLLKSIVNGLPSNEVEVQIPIPSPINNNLMAMDESGYNKDSGVSATTDYLSNDDEHLPTSKAMQSAISSVVASDRAFQGQYDASSNLFPALNRFGDPIKIGDNWNISAGGTFPGGEVVNPGDDIMAITDLPGQDPLNWAINALSQKADLSYVNAELALKSDLTYVNAQLALKSDLTYVNDELELKADLSYVNSELDLIDAALAGKINSTTGTAIQKADGSGGLTAAISGTDYQPPVPSPTLDNFVSMDATGVNKNSGVALSTSPASNDNSHVPSTAAMQSAISTAITSGSSFRPGGYDASSNLFPSTGGSGSAGAIRAGDYWIITVAGTLGGTPVLPNDSLQSMVNSPGQTASNWIINGAVTKTYVDNQLALKSPINNPTFTGNVSVPIPSAAADATRKDYVDSGLSGKEPTITALPATKGGTGQTSYTIGDLLYASSSSALSKLAAPADFSILRGNGPGVAPSWDINLIRSYFQRSSTVTISTTQTEIVIAIAPLMNLSGFYTLELLDVANSRQLTVNYLVIANKYYLGYPPQSLSPFATPKLEILSVNDTQNIINESNISQYFTFMARLRTSSPNTYVAITARMSGGLIYSSGDYEVTCTSYSQAFLSDNTTIAQYVSQLYSSLASLASSTPYLINTTYVAPVTTYGANLYVFCVNNGTTTINMYRMNTATGILSNNSPSTATVGSSPRTMVVSKNGRFAYASNSGANNIQMMLLDLETGILTNNSPSTIGAGTTPNYMAILPAYQNFLYVTNRGSASVSVYTLDRSTGLLTIASTPAVGGTPVGIVITNTTTAQGVFAYVASNAANNIYMFQVNTTSGALNPLGTPTIAKTGVHSLLIHPNGSYLYASSDTQLTITVFSINPSTGILTSIQTPATTGVCRELAITPNGSFLYAASIGDNTIQMYSVASNGQLTSIGTFPFTNANSIRMSPNGLFLYVASSTSNDVTVLRIDQNTGLLTSAGTIAAGSSAFNITIV